MDVNKSSKTHDDLMHQALKIFGDVWNLSIVRVLSETTQRFNELQRSLGNISPTTLTDRLKKTGKLRVDRPRKADRRPAVGHLFSDRQGQEDAAGSGSN